MELKNKIAQHFIVKPPLWSRKLYPEAIWKMPTGKKRLYLTFDDGPQEDITTFVLDELAKHNAKATFFCIGKNIERNPAIFEHILKAGHSTGNHTQDHLNGWKSKNEDYYRNIESCENVLKHSSSQAQKLFRPPYGKVLHSQYRTLKEKYQFVFWDVLSMDYDISKTPETVTNNVLKHASNGSIIVFHDSGKASKNLRYALPIVLAYFSEKGFSFESL